MLIRAEDDGVVAIGQASHAWVSGQLARAWGNARFPTPQPREEVCLAAEQHDVGMAEWDLEPRLQPGANRPQGFTEMALRDHLRLWSAAPTKLLTQSRYAALLVSLHGTALYERRDLARMPPADAGAVRDYLAGEYARQERLIELVGADRALLRRNQRLMLAWDGLSLALCLRWGSHVAERVPAAGAADLDVRLEPAAGGSFSVHPWPFTGDEVTVRCEGRRLRASHETESELRAAFEEAHAVTLAFTLVAGDRAGG